MYCTLLEYSVEVYMQICTNKLIPHNHVVALSTKDISIQCCVKLIYDISVYMAKTIFILTARLTMILYE